MPVQTALHTYQLPATYLAGDGVWPEPGVSQPLRGSCSMHM